MKSGLRCLAILLVLSACAVPGNRPPAEGPVTDKSTLTSLPVSAQRDAGAELEANARAQLTAQDSCLRWGYRAALPIDLEATRCAHRRTTPGEPNDDSTAPCTRYEALRRFQCLR